MLRIEFDILMADIISASDINLLDAASSSFFNRLKMFMAYSCELGLFNLAGQQVCHKNIVFLFRLMFLTQECS